MREKLLATLRVSAALLFATTVTNILPSTLVLAAQPADAGKPTTTQVEQASTTNAAANTANTNATVNSTTTQNVDTTAQVPTTPVEPAKKPVVEEQTTPAATANVQANANVSATVHEQTKPVDVPKAPVQEVTKPELPVKDTKVVEDTSVKQPEVKTQPVVAEVANTSIYAKALSDHECNAYEWHFVITQVKDEASAPHSIYVQFTGGHSATLSLDKYTGKTAHYSTTKYLDEKVLSATTSIYSGWSGQFNLSHGPCNEEEHQTPKPAVLYVKVMPCHEDRYGEMTHSSVGVSIYNPNKESADYYVSLDGGNAVKVTVSAYATKSYTFANVHEGMHTVKLYYGEKLVSSKTVEVKDCEKEDHDHHKRPELMVKVMPCVEHRDNDRGDDHEWLMNNDHENGEVRVTVTNPNHEDATYTLWLDGGQMMTVHVEGNSSKTVTYEHVSVGNHEVTLKGYDHILATEHFHVNKCENEHEHHEHGLMKPTVVVTAETCSTANGATGTVTVKVTNNGEGNRVYTVTLAGQFTKMTERLKEHETATVTFMNVPAGTHTVVASAKPTKFLTASTHVTVMTCAVVTPPVVTPPTVTPTTTVVRTIPAGGFGGGGRVLGAVTVASVTPVGGFGGGGRVLGASTTELANTGDSSMINLIVGFTVIAMALSLAGVARKQRS